MSADYTDDVRGIIIGGDDRTLYKFYTIVPPGIEHHLDMGLFEDDAAAEAWIKERYPAAYANGIEMRAFDASRKGEAP